MQEKQPSLGLSLIPIVVLMVLLFSNILIYGDGASSGANQMALLISASLAFVLGLFVLKINYEKLEAHVLQSIQMAMQANVILLIVGSLIGLWILSGIVPAMIFYGLKLINPSVFLPVSCVVCAIVALSTGSSWSTIGTVGVALIGIGKTLGIPEGMVAGSIISGAYFGDKMSPLSDTTNLAPAMAGTDLFTHIRHMVYTSVPAFILALIGFAIVGFFYGQGEASVETMQAVFITIKANFSIGIHLFLAPALVIFMVYKKIPALPALAIGCLIGIIFALLFQHDLLVKLSGGEFNFANFYKTVMTTSYNGFSIETGNKAIDSLFNRGGMSSMLNTVWLIMCAMIFGGALEGTGMLQKIAESILRLVHGTGSLIGATLASCIFVNITACDQFLSIVVPGRMFRKAYEDFGLHPKNLSRALEDSGTLTSVMVPWNTCGAYSAGVLSVATFTYAPYCFFNILSPFVSGFLAGMDWTIERKKVEA